MELIDEKEWSLPVVVAQRDIFREISVHNNRDSLLSQFPKLQTDFSTLIPQFISEETKPTGLAEQLTNCRPGQQDWCTYEDICIAILKKVFVPPLKSIEPQARTESGLERRDALLPLLGAKEGWEEISHKYDAHFLLCEFKNYVDPIDKDEVNQAGNYLKRHIGKLGIIFSRMPPSPSALKMQRSIYSDSQKLILFFEDKHLIELLKLKEAHQNPLELIQDAILNFQRLCRHLPEGRTLALPSMKPRKTRIGMAALPEALSACSRIVHSKAPRFKKCLHNFLNT